MAKKGTDQKYIIDKKPVKVNKIPEHTPTLAEKIIDHFSPKPKPPKKLIEVRDLSRETNQQPRIGGHAK